MNTRDLLGSQIPESDQNTEPLCFLFCITGALCTDFLMLKNTAQMQVNYSVTTWIFPGGWLIMVI